MNCMVQKAGRNPVPGHRFQNEIGGWGCGQLRHRFVSRTLAATASGEVRLGPGIGFGFSSFPFYFCCGRPSRFPFSLAHTGLVAFPKGDFEVTSE